MSLCDICTRPGRCCSGFVLNSEELNACTTTLESLAFLASVCVAVPDRGPGAVETGLPFMPMWRRPDGYWRFWCPNLESDGRCGDYENRPYTCRWFDPASGDELCAMNTNAITRGMSVPRIGGPT